MKNITVARKMAFCGLLLAFSSIIFILVNIIETNTIALLVLASFLILPVVIEIDKKTASIFLLASSILAFLIINDKIRALVYITSVGNYGLVKALIESRFPVLGSKFELIFNRQTPIKIAYANIVLIFMYIEAKYMIGFVLPDKPLYILAFLVLYQIGFLSFDYIMTEAIAYYHNKIKKLIKFNH